MELTPTLVRGEFKAHLIAEWHRSSVYDSFSLLMPWQECCWLGVWEHPSLPALPLLALLGLCTHSTREIRPSWAISVSQLTPCLSLFTAPLWDVTTEISTQHYTHTPTYSALRKYSAPLNFATFCHISGFKHKDIKLYFFAKNQQVGHNHEVERHLLDISDFFNKSKTEKLGVQNYSAPLS